MVVLGTLCLVGILAGWAFGGRVGRLSQSRLVGEQALLLMMIAHLVLPQVAKRVGIDASSVVVLWLLSALALLGLALLNGRWVGMWLAALGLVMNIIVVAVNGGMPVDVSWMQGSGVAEARAIDALAQSGLHRAATDNTHFSGLADVVAIPSAGGLTTMVSVGDLVLALGVGVTIMQMMLVTDVVVDESPVAETGGAGRGV